MPTNDLLHPSQKNDNGDFFAHFFPAFYHELVKEITKMATFPPHQNKFVDHGAQPLLIKCKKCEFSLLKSKIQVLLHLTAPLGVAKVGHGSFALLALEASRDITRQRLMPKQRDTRGIALRSKAKS